MRLFSERLIRPVFHKYWQISRGLTLGAQGVIIDSGNRVLLIRHTYRPGWHFPGGGVEKNETVLTALSRELEEEAGVTATLTPQLFSIYANFRFFPSDHITLFIVRHWHQAKIPEPNSEIAEQGFFSINDLPSDINPSTQRRLVEIFEDIPPAEMW